MVSINLFQSVVQSKAITYEPDNEHDNINNPTFDYNCYVYELLYIFLSHKNIANHIKNEFINDLFMLFDSNDIRERDYVKNCIHQIYRRFLSLRPHIKNSIMNFIHRFLFDDTGPALTRIHDGVSTATTGPALTRIPDMVSAYVATATTGPNGIIEILHIVISFTSGFSIPVKKEHINFLKYYIIPLFGSPYFLHFGNELYDCVNQYMMKDQTLTLYIVEEIIKHFHNSPPKKQRHLIIMLKDIINISDNDTLKQIFVPILTKIAKCVNSEMFPVANEALRFIADECVMKFFIKLKRHMIPLFFSNIYTNINNHWSDVIVKLSRDAIKFFGEISQKICDECMNKYIEKTKHDAMKRIQFKNKWEIIEQMANERNESTDIKN
jgi:serine/threonine-protein phosphatase 2A regulatory subunit B'